ncbi:MAG TPA: hypothetical protein VK610_01100, partial [Rhodothermales bacterium]|nr:hypothetical protein [Rhodothermales bacterium]
MGRFSAPRPFLARVRRAAALRATQPAAPPVVPLARRSAGPVATAAALGLVVAAPAFAQGSAPYPLGPPRRVNLFTPGAQAIRATATYSDGQSVVVWTGEGASGPGVYGRLVNVRPVN